MANYAWAYGRTWIPRSVYRKLKFPISNVDPVFNFMGIWVELQSLQTGRFKNDNRCYRDGTTFPAVVHEL